MCIDRGRLSVHQQFHRASTTRSARLGLFVTLDIF